MMKRGVLLAVFFSFLVCSCGFSATTTFSWSDATFASPEHYLYEADGTTVAGFNTWNFYVYVVNSTPANVGLAATAGAAGPLAGSSLIEGGVTWADNVFTAGSLTDGNIAGANPSIATSASGWTGYATYIYFENATATYCGFVWGNNWIVPDDSVNPQTLTMDISREFMGTGGINATGGSGSALNTDGWSATNAIPEPGTMALFAIGMLTLGARSLRRRK